MDKSVTKKLILIGVVLFMGLNGLLIFLMQRQTEEAFVEMSEELVSQTAYALRYWMDDQIRFAHLIANSQVIKMFTVRPENETLREQAENELIRLNDRYDFYDSMPITLVRDQPILTVRGGTLRTIENGQVILDATGISNVGIAELPEEDIQQIVDGAPFVIGNLHQSHLTDNIVFDVSVPVYDREENIVGILTLATHVKHFTKVFVDNKAIGKTGYMFLIDYRGNIIAHPVHEYILNDSTEIVNQSKKLISRIEMEEDTFVENFLGVRKFYYGQKVSIHGDTTDYHNDYYIVVTQDWLETMEGVFAISMWVFVLTLITGVLLFRINLLLTETHNRKQHEDQLVSMNKMLEEKVDERTKELKRLAVTDGLTGLYNHRHSLDLLGNMLNTSDSRQRPITVLLMDLDFFKIINDTYGHQAGDEVLKKVATVTKNVIRQDDFAGRYGGEEFIVVLDNCSQERGRLIAERIRSTIEATTYEQIDKTITISIGLATWRGESVVALVKKSDELLYQAKRDGRNRVVVG